MARMKINCAKTVFKTWTKIAIIVEKLWIALYFLKFRTSCYKISI